jgi:DNA invertase Pin-like site-specific DNA recombinase
MARKSRKNLETAPEITALTFNAAGYVRLSVEDNHKKGDSVDTQKALLQNFITLSTDIKLHDFYIDNGMTGVTFDRPAFQRMLADAESGVINCIIVKDLSRLGRSAIDTGYYIEKYLPSLNVRFIAVNDDFDSARDMENGAGVMLPLKNMINEAYALDIGRKIRAQQNQAMKAGEFVGSRPPFGYIKAPDNCHKLIIDPEASEVVKLIFQWAYDKDGLNTITRR